MIYPQDPYSEDIGEMSSLQCLRKFFPPKNLAQKIWRECYNLQRGHLSSLYDLAGCLTANYFGEFSGIFRSICPRYTLKLNGVFLLQRGHLVYSEDILFSLYLADISSPDSSSSPILVTCKTLSLSPQPFVSLSLSLARSLSSLSRPFSLRPPSHTENVSFHFFFFFVRDFKNMPTRADLC